ncbi:MAG: type II secretion system protein [Deltaproteobacteria bacterium]
MTRSSQNARPAGDETPRARFRRAESVASLIALRLVPLTPSSRLIPCSALPSRPARRRQAGVTLVEVLIVVAIMAMLGGSVGFYALQQYKKAEASTALEDARNLRKAVELWQVQNAESTCPTLNELVADKQINSDSHQVDPWGQEWSITCSDDEIFVQSSGPDRKPGTPDDIRVPKLQAGSES